MITLQNYVVELSKYVILAFMLLYTGMDVLIFVLPNRLRRDALYGLQNACMMAFLFLCFLDLTFVTGEQRYLYLFGFLLLFLFAMILLYSLIYDKVNRLVLNNFCMLLGIGFSVISRLQFEKAYKQFLAVLVAFAICLVIPYLFDRVPIWKKLTWAYGLFGIGALAAVLLLGELTNGSKITFTVAGLTFQPSEFVKILYLFYLAAMLCRKADLTHVALSAVLAGAHVLILVMSRDLGSALIYFATYVLIVYAMTEKVRYLLLGAVGGVLASYIAYQRFAHVRSRFLAWKDPWTYIDGKGYQITQSLFAITSGSWFGMGLLQGNPEDIPFVEADFIFSAICEEFGLIFGICLIVIFLVICFEMLRCARLCRDRFYGCLMFGTGVLILFQAFLTIGGGLKFIPLTGVTLPLISYGRSSAMTVCFLFGIFEGAYLKMVRYESGRLSPSGELLSIDAGAEAEDEEPSGEESLQEESGQEAAATERKEGKKRKSRFRLSALVVPSVQVGFFLLFGAMCFYIGDYVKHNETILINNSYNSRQETILSRNYRGTIYSADGDVLAESRLDAEQNETRVYPYGRLFAHAVGYDVMGRSGVESLANYYLINTHISIPAKVANDTAERKNPGDNVYTTLNVEMQQIADDYLKMYDGAVIVTEVKTGRILAELSHPDFDPSEIEAQWEELTQDEDSSVLVNRVTHGLYPPGSTFKILTALAYYEQEGDAWKKYRYSCNGHFSKDGNSISCYHGISHGSVDFTKSFAKSCNSSFANIGMGLDWKEFGEFLEERSFGSSLPIDLPCAVSVTPAGESLGTYDRMQTSIGQGTTLMTPLHLHLITTAIANGGVWMKPYLVERVVTAEGNAVKTFSPVSGGRWFREEESAFLREMMEEVVASGTATKLQSDRYRAAGKTGSAEFGEVKGESHAWFTGYAPAEDPQVAITVIIEGAGSGGDYAVPLARRIFDCYFETHPLAEAETE